MQTKQTTITISLGSEQEFLKFVERMVKRAERHGLTEISVTRGQEVVRTRSFIEVEGGVEIGSRQVNVSCVQYVVTNPTPVIAGWSVVASVENTEAGNLTHLLPTAVGVEIPVSVRTLGTSCQHCNTDRPRRQLYILRNESTGEFRQVG